MQLTKNRNPRKKRRPLSQPNSRDLLLVWAGADIYRLMALFQEACAMDFGEGEYKTAIALLRNLDQYVTTLRDTDK